MATRVPMPLLQDAWGGGGGGGNTHQGKFKHWIELKNFHLALLIWSYILHEYKSGIYNY